MNNQHQPQARPERESRTRAAVRLISPNHSRAVGRVLTANHSRAVAASA